MTPTLSGKVAIITGASRGIGYDIAHLFLAHGASVAITYRNAEVGGEAVARLSAAHPQGKVMGYAKDVSVAVDVEALFAAVSADLGAPEIVVNNAGITKDNLMLRMKEEDWDAVIDTNLKGTFLMCRAAIKVMLKAKKGRIINVASVVAQIGNPGQANYCASKGGVLSLTKSLAREVASRSITVNAIAPGFVATDMTSDLKEEVKTALLSQIPLGRLGTGADIAEAALFLAGEGASYITGQTLSVNGGLAMV
jgi:3-oxoacyl-[acyl-carrier protein] reductase